MAVGWPGTTTASSGGAGSCASSTEFEIIVASVVTARRISSLGICDASKRFLTISSVKGEVERDRCTGSWGEDGADMLGVANFGNFDADRTNFEAKKERYYSKSNGSHCDVAISEFHELSSGAKFSKWGQS